MSKIRRYTKEQEDFILRNALKKSNRASHQDLAKMFDRTVEGIRKKELELKRKHTMKRRLHVVWTDDEIEKLNEIMSKEYFSMKEARECIGKDTKTIMAKMYELRTSSEHNNNQYSRPWTEEEEDYLRRWWGIKEDILIGIYLCRTIEALVIRAKKLGIRNKKIYYTARECARMLNYSDTRFINYIQKKYIKTRTATTEQYIHQIKVEWLHEFMKNYQHLYDTRDIKENIFVGTEPEWYIEKKKRDRENPVGYLDYQRKWTEEEKKYLFEARERGESYEAIAKKLDRKASAIKSKWNGRRDEEKKRLEREEKKRLKKEKEDEYERLKVLEKELENERNYILKHVKTIVKGEYTEEDIELLSNLRMLGYNSTEVKSMVGLNGKHINQILDANKNEEYVIYISPYALKEDEQLRLFEETKNKSLYELCMEFNKDYLYIIKTYKDLLKDKYEGDLMNMWTIEDEIKMMLMKSDGMKTRLVAQKLRRGTGAIRSRINLISTRKFVPEKRAYTKDEDKLIKIYKERGLNMNILSCVLKRTVSAINNRYYHHIKKGR